MKNLFFAVIIAAFTMTSVNAQTEKGEMFLEANTGFGAAHASNTSFSYTSTKVGNDTASNYNLGLEGGYFIMDDLAVKVGLGYGGSSYGSLSTSTFSYKVGAKYYLMSNIPVQIDINGASIKDAVENPMYLGLQGGYSFRLSDSVAIEPGLRYDLSMNDKFSKEGIIQFKIGFLVNL